MTDGGGATVLVVEDDPTISDLLSYNLERAGYSVLQEGTGRGALERSMDPHLAVDLILMDLMLPGLDGMAASREIRRRRPQLPIIMLTARAERETLLEGFAAGADDYITKPFDVDELLARIGARIKNRRDRKESSPATPSDAVEAGTVRLDPNTHKLRTALGEVTLSPKEHDLFALWPSFPPQGDSGECLAPDLPSRLPISGCAHPATAQVPGQIARRYLNRDHPWGRLPLGHPDDRNRRGCRKRELMSRIGRRLLLVILLVTAVAVSIPAVATGRFVAKELDAQEERSALSRAGLTAAALNRVSADSAPGDPVTSLYNLEWMRGVVEEAGSTTNVRISVFGKDGTLLANSLTDALHEPTIPPQPEITAALTGRPSVSRRDAPGLDEIWLYAAIPLDQGNSPWSSGALRIAIPAHQDSAARADLWRLPLLIGIILLLPATLLAYRFSRRLLEPVEHLVAMSQEVAGGDITYRVGTAGREDELAHLSRSLNSMMDNIQGRMDKLISAEEETAGILAAMTDGVLVLDESGQVIDVNQAATRMLETTSAALKGSSIVHRARAFPALGLIERARNEGIVVNERVEMPGNRHLVVQSMRLTPSPGRKPRILLVFRDETDRIRIENMRRDFVTNVSHELKTPLSGLSLLTNTLRHAIDEDPEAARRFVDRLTAETDRLNALANDLLTLSQLDEQGEPDAESRDLVDFSTLVAETAESLREKSTEKGLGLEVETEEGMNVIGDRIELHQLVRNLLDNAVRYTDKGGKVSVRLEGKFGQSRSGAGGTEAGAQVVLTVEDTGVGIPTTTWTECSNASTEWTRPALETRGAQAWG